MPYDVRALTDAGEKGRVSREILSALPDWFGNPEALEKYVLDSMELPVYACFDGGTAVGFAACRQHNECSCEIWVMGVRERWHRAGVGRALVECAKAFAASRGCRNLMVKTLDGSNPDPCYARTRRFYRAMGFEPLCSFKEIWDEENPCLVMVMRLGEE